MNLKPSKIKPEIHLYWEEKDYPELQVDLKGFDMFMIQPFLAIKLKSNFYFRDNFNFKKGGKFYYAFYFDTVELDQVESIGIALTSFSGEVWTAIVDNSILEELKTRKKINN